MESCQFGSSREQSQATALFDRFRPTAVASMACERPFDRLIETAWFPPLLVWALPEFMGDATAAIAMLDEAYVQAAAASIPPLNRKE